MFHNAKRKPTKGHDSESPTYSCSPQSLLTWDPTLSSHFRSPSSKLFYSRFPTKTTYTFFALPILYMYMHCNLSDFTTLTTLRSHVNHAVGPPYKS